MNLPEGPFDFETAARLIGMAGDPALQVRVAYLRVGKLEHERIKREAVKAVTYEPVPIEAELSVLMGFKVVLDESIEGIAIEWKAWPFVSLEAWDAWLAS